VSELFTSVSRSASAGQAVEQHIKELIKARRLLAGDKLPAERNLAERMGVSRSTLRGALQSLAEQGVLTGRHGAGWTVQARGHIVAANLEVYFSLEEVSFGQLFEARRAIEPHIAAAAAANRTEEQIIALKRCISAMRATSDTQQYLQADSDLHQLSACYKTCASACPPRTASSLRATTSTTEYSTPSSEEIPRRRNKKCSTTSTDSWPAAAKF